MIKSNSFSSKAAPSTASTTSSSTHHVNRSPASNGGSTTRQNFVTSLGNHEFETRLLKTKNSLSKSSSVRNIVRIENGGAGSVKTSNDSNNNYHRHTTCCPPSPVSSRLIKGSGNKPPPPPSPNTASYIYGVQRPLLFTTPRYRSPSRNRRTTSVHCTPTEVNNNTESSADEDFNNNNNMSNTTNNSGSNRSNSQKNDSLIYSRQGSVRGNVNKVRTSVRQVFHDDSSSSSSLSVTNSSQFNYSSTTTSSSCGVSSIIGGSSNSNHSSNKSFPVLHSIQLNSVASSPRSSVGSVKTFSNLLLVRRTLIFLNFVNC
jgi:hypothetical protein